jgi:hypothetical protein
MFVKTYLYGNVDLQVASLVGEKVLCVLERAEIPADEDREASSIEAGWVLVRRGAKYAVFKSVESALRACYNAVVYYSHTSRGDIVEQTALREDARSFVKAVKGPKRKAPELESAIAGSAATLAGDSNRAKAKARKDLRAAASATDRLGRDNRSRQLMLLGHAEFQLGERVNDDRRIHGEMFRLRRNLRFYYRKCKKALEEAKVALDGILADPIWKERNATEAKSDRLKIAAARLMRVSDEQIAELKILRIEPFIFHRDLAMGGLNNARYWIENGQLFSAERYFTTALAAVRVALAHIWLNKAHFEFDLAVQESHEPGSDSRVVAELISGHAAKLTKFAAKLAQVNGTPVPPRSPKEAGERVVAAVASVNEKKYDTAAKLLKEAVALL